MVQCSAAKLAEYFMRGSGQTIVVVAGLALFIVAGSYVLSSGPVFAYHCRHPHSSTSGVCRYYRPLFHIAPSLMARYANWWGVSEIEVFLLLEPAQQTGAKGL
jgi:hypothetical protein